ETYGAEVEEDIERRHGECEAAEHVKGENPPGGAAPLLAIKGGERGHDVHAGGQRDHAADFHLRAVTKLHGVWADSHERPRAKVGQDIAADVTGQGSCGDGAAIQGPR